MRVKITNSTAKIAELKTMAVTKVAVDAVFAAVLMSDLQTSQSSRKPKGRKDTYMADGRKEELLNAEQVLYIKAIYFDNA